MCAVADSDFSLGRLKRFKRSNLLLSQLLDETIRSVKVLVELIRQKEQTLLEFSKLPCDLGSEDPLVLIHVVQHLE